MARYPWWKEYYARERVQKRGAIAEACKRAPATTDGEVSGVLERGGILSFPHTRIEDSLEALVRTVDSLYKTGKQKVIALGVLHNVGEGSEEKEFSLDGFEHIAKVYADVNGIKPIEIEKVYPPLKEEEKPHIQTLEEAGEALRGKMDDKTAVVMTGDLVHYGHGYLRGGERGYELAPREEDIDSEKNHEEKINGWIDEGLDLVYHKKDYDAFLNKHKPKALNDQGAVAIMASALLGDGLEYGIFYGKLSDYSGVLSGNLKTRTVKKPTVVASVFYGVWPKARAG